MTADDKMIAMLNCFSDRQLESRRKTNVSKILWFKFKKMWIKKIISNKLFISYVKLQIQYNENNKEN